MLMRLRSMQARLLALLAAVVLVVGSAALAAAWLEARHEVDELLDGHLAQAAALLVVQQVGEIEDDEAGVDAPALHRYAPKVAFQVFHKGRLVLHSANAPHAAMVDTPAAGFRNVRIEGRDWRVFTARGADRDVLVHVGEQAASRGAIVRAMLEAMLWPMLLALPVLGLGAWWAIRGGIAPLARLGGDLAARHGADLKPVAVPGAPSELEPVLQALNGLFGRIAGLLDAERRFTADAAHELRTPIAAIRAQAQVALNEADDASRRHALVSALRGCDRATRVVEQLLTLARLEADAGTARHQVDLGALARNVAGELAPAAVARGQSLEVRAEPGSVAGDETLLALLLRNLLDNAMRYSPRGARVVVSARRSGGRMTLAVDDSGPGLAEPQLARLGERFFRAHPEDAQGSGLGWSIAHRIAAAHGAQLQARRSDALGGLCAEVVFGQP
jgi:two-component system sensor histidine kinase QseC